MADGVGSRSAAAESADAACSAVRDAAVTHPEVGFSPDRFSGVLEASWRLRLAEFDDSQIGSTCLFSWKRRDGRLVVGQCGDGLVLLVGKDSRTQPLGQERQGWLNEVNALGTGGVWITRELDSTVLSAVILATDGVADDIESDKYDELAGLLESLRGAGSRRGAAAQLRAALSRWPNSSTGDDMTLAVHFL